MKIRHIASILCRKALIDQRDGSFSISEFIEEIRVDIRKGGESEKSEKSKMIQVPIIFDFVSVWYREDKDGKSKAKVYLDFIDPAGKKLSGHNFSLDFQGKRRLRATTRVDGLHLTGSGTYWLKLYLENGQKKLVSSSPLDVVINEV